MSAVEETKNSQRTTTREGPSETKRKHTEDESVNDDDADNETPQTPTTPQAYNTRYKGVKRVKIWRDVPEGYSYTPLRRKPRKSAPAVLVSASGSNENAVSHTKYSSVLLALVAEKKKFNIASETAKRAASKIFQASSNLLRSFNI